jgi:hypothetical protein
MYRKDFFDQVNFGLIVAIAKLGNRQTRFSRATN